MGISDDAQGDIGLAMTELSAHLWEMWSINVQLEWSETAAGVWTAEIAG